MEGHTQHTNGHAKKSSSHHATPAAKRAVKRAVRRGTALGKRFERSAQQWMKSQGRTFAEVTDGAAGWIKTNPKTAAGVFIASGAIIGVLATSRVGRAAVVALGGLATYLARQIG
jgi:hypothetical protein